MLQYKCHNIREPSIKIEGASTGTLPLSTSMLDPNMSLHQVAAKLPPSKEIPNVMQRNDTNEIRQEFLEISEMAFPVKSMSAH